MRRYVLIFLLFQAVVAANAQDPTTYWREAQDCFNKGDYECAIKQYTAWEKLSQKSGGAAAEIKKAENCKRTKQTADGYYDKGDKAKACTEYGKLLALNPKDNYAKQRKEESCVVVEEPETPTVQKPQQPDRKQPDRKQPDQKQPDQKPSNTPKPDRETHLHLYDEAKECLYKGDYDCAITKYNEFGRLSSIGVEVEVGKAESYKSIKQAADKYYEDKDYKKACAKYEELLAKNPGDTYAEQQKGKSCGGRGGNRENEDFGDSKDSGETGKPITTSGTTSGTPSGITPSEETDPFLLGDEYYSNKDYKEAAGWFLESAEQGDRKGQNNLGMMYEKGLGVKQDYAKAVRWYAESAEQGLDVAQYNLGLMYEYGYGVKKNHKEAVRWLQRSANQGNQEAMDFLNNYK
jgi:tetratricopeptide (TPR) repeat protein